MTKGRSWVRLELAPMTARLAAYLALKAQACSAGRAAVEPRPCAAGSRLREAVEELQPLAAEEPALLGGAHARRA